MKLGYLAALTLLIATPALSGTTKSVGDISFECAVTGGSNDGFDIYVKNAGKATKSCAASCKLTKADGKTEEFEEKNTVKTGSQRFWFGGRAGLKGGPLKSPDLTKASCS